MISNDLMFHKDQEKITQKKKNMKNENLYFKFLKSTKNKKNGNKC